MTTKKQSRQQACWAEFLSRFNFLIFCTLSKKNEKVDLLIYQSNDYPADDQDD